MIYFKMKVFIKEDSCQLGTQTETKPLAVSCPFFFFKSFPCQGHASPQNSGAQNK